MEEKKLTERKREEMGKMKGGKVKSREEEIKNMRNNEAADGIGKS